MKLTTATIGNLKIKVYLAISEEQQERGFMNQKADNFKSNEAILFVFDKEEKDRCFWMKNTSIPLDIIFINKDFEVVQISKGTPNCEDKISCCFGSKYVLELKTPSKVCIDDELDFDTDVLEEEEGDDLLHVINTYTGKVDMKLESGERIFSRKNTKSLIRMAKNASKSKSDADYKRLGTKIFKYIKIQDEREPEYAD